MPRIADTQLARALLVGLVAAVLVGASPAASAQDEAPDRIALSELADRPERFVGGRIAVTGAVEDLYGRGLFSIDDDPVWSREDQVLVLNARPAGQLRAGSEITVIGRLHMFSEEAFDDRYGAWDRDIDDDLIAGFERRPVIVAESIQLVAEEDDPRDFVALDRDDRERVTIVDRNAPADWAAPLPAAGPDPIAATADDIEDDPERFYGRKVLVRADVDDIYARTVFELEDNVIVIAPGLAPGIEDGDEVAVVGTVVRFSRSEIEGRVPGYTLDLSAEVLDDFEDEPAILATSIQSDDTEELIATPR
jgi:hypothetical protein